MTLARKTPQAITVSVVTPDPGDDIRAMLSLSYEGQPRAYIHLLTASDLLALDRAIFLARREIIEGALLSHEAAAIKAVADASGGAA